jgi:hypothetical protein
MTTPVIVTDYNKIISFNFDMNGNVVAVLVTEQTVVQDPQTMEIIATSAMRSNMPLAEAQQIIANAQEAPASSVQQPLGAITQPVINV